MSPPSAALPDQAPAQRLQAVLARLALSRAALRHELMPSEPAGGAGSTDAAGGAPLRQLWQSLGRFSRRWPVAAVVADAARAWWHKHPWRATGDLLVHSLASQGQALVRRHPVATVAGAALLGGLLMALRPWRWQVVGRQLQPVPGQVGHWLIGQLASAPVQAALASLVLMALRPADTAGADDELPPAPQNGAAPYNSEDRMDGAGAKP